MIDGPGVDYEWIEVGPSTLQSLQCVDLEFEVALHTNN